MRINSNSNDWSDADTMSTTLNIETIAKDQSNENCLFVETSSYRIRLAHVESEKAAAHIVLDVQDKKNILENVTDAIMDNAGKATQAVMDHPFALGVPLSIAGVGMSATLIGFGAAGIVGGSIAAAIQSSIGNVAAGSLFATMQSLGATGTFTAMTTGGIAATAGSAAVVAATNNKGEDEGDKSKANKEESNDKRNNEDDSSNKEHHFDDIRKLVGSKAMISEDMKLLRICHES